MQTVDTLTLVPAADANTRALAWLERLATQQQWPPRLAHHLRLCLDEALTNVIQHGFDDHKNAADEAMIRIDVRQQETEVLLDIVDNGAAFDPTLAESPPMATSIDDARIGGQGLRLMRHYLRDIQYRRERGRNHLRLVATIYD